VELRGLAGRQPRRETEEVQAVDYKRFLERLPSLYQDWGQTSARPQSSRFQEVLVRVRGMTSPGVLQLLNSAVALLEEGEGYCEVGCFQGATLIGALLGSPERPAWAADNFSQFDPQGLNRAALLKNLLEFGVRDQVLFHDSDAEDFLTHLGGSGANVGVYFYDGSHDYRAQLLCLLLAVPALARRALIVVDDTNGPAPRQATFDFLAVRPEAQLLLDLPTPGNGHPSFWNGLLVLAWDVERRPGTDRDVLRQGRQPALLESLRALQFVHLKEERGVVHMIRAG
jgi:hypothetical protein